MLSILSLVRHRFDREISDHTKTGRLPSTFRLNDSKYYDALANIRSKVDRLAYLRALIPIINIPPSFAVSHDAGGIHSGFLSPYRVLRQSDLVDVSTWNYLKAQRLNENLLLNCSGILPLPLAKLIIEMRAKFNLLTEPWWPILVGVSDSSHREIMDILQKKYQLHGAHLQAWETRQDTLDKKDYILICANRGETIYELSSDTNYIIQIDADQRECCLGNAANDGENLYKDIVKIEPRTK